MYRTHGEVMLLRAAAVPVTSTPHNWPDLGDSDRCRQWLAQAWKSESAISDAIELASPALAARIEAILDGDPVPDRRIRSVTASVVRYVLRASGRPTPFGLFAGVAAGCWADDGHARIGTHHRAALKCDSQWLSDIITALEARPDLLERLDVVFNNLAMRRGSRLELATGQHRVTIRCTWPVHAAQIAAARPLRFGVLAAQLAEQDPDARPETVHDLLQTLVRQGFLITNLRAPMTAADPLGHLLAQLRAAGGCAIAGLADLTADLTAVHRDLLSQDGQAVSQQAAPRARLSASMRRLSAAGRTPLCLDLILDSDVQLPALVAADLAEAAAVLTRLSPNPAGSPAWASYHEVFTERYGAGALVPLLDVVDPGAGIGFPAGYPGSVLPAPPSAPRPRDERLAALAWQAVADGRDEIVLTRETIAMLTEGDAFDSRYVQPHVEMAATVRAVSRDALDGGDYTLVVAPARAAGTLTSRFSPIAAGSGLGEVYRQVPELYAGALPVQLSFPPLYPRGANVSRLPAFLDHLLPLGEHRPTTQSGTIIGLHELAVAATRRGLVLVWLTTGQLIEPQVFHALALEKQAPPLARFLAGLPRAFAAEYLAFDWGPCARLMPNLPQVRYGRTFLSPARWRLTTADLPGEPTAPAAWHEALLSWQASARCPGQVELHDGDLTLGLDLGVPAHVGSLRRHLAARGTAILTPRGDPAQLGWLDGHSHEIAVPLVRAGPPAPAQLPALRPALTGPRHGQLPSSSASHWLSAKIFAHPDCLHQIIEYQLSDMLAALEDSPSAWFVRYRSRTETDHLRLRIRTGSTASCARHAAAIATWTEQLQAARLAGRLAFDTYYPEEGRYGPGEAMHAAEAVFAADSLTVLAQLSHPPTHLAATTLTALSMLDIAEAFLGSMPAAATWLTTRAARPGRPLTRTIASAAITIARTGTPREAMTAATQLSAAMQHRASALASYRDALPASADASTVLDSLIHLHHNRMIGIDPDSEASCRHLLRQAALAWQSASHQATP